ncbi:hypothetical protein [Pantoea sp. SS70]|uniref:hypothetical protein n=1 Tax=Pantoea sp. SS70 TaxID=3024247 RepID=UPI0024536749|nr:hypothetical protein [Pantoea sp. SS70]WGK58981.1 hypothetical protein PO881_09320 [Pantoea sp. SS70]
MKKILVVLVSVMLLAFLVIVYYRHFPGQFTSTKSTDWISASANIIMASAAITGLMVARDWKSELAKHKSFELSIKFMIDDLHHLFFSLKYRIFYSLLSSQISNIVCTDKLQVKHFEQLYSVYWLAMKNHNEIDASFSNVKRSMYSLYILNIKFNGKYDDIFREIEKTVQQFLAKSSFCLGIISSIYLPQLDVEVQNHDFKDFDINRIHITQLENIASEMEKVNFLRLRLTNLVSKMEEDRPTIFDIFKFNKNK